MSRGGRVADRHLSGEDGAGAPAQRRAAGSMGVALRRVRHRDVEAVYPATRDFFLGVASDTPEGFLEIDFGEGRRRFEQRVGGFYLHPTAVEADLVQTGWADLVFVSAPMAALAEGLEMEEATLWTALRPLHDTLGADLRLRSRVAELWAHAARAGPFAALTVDHGVLALAAALAERARPDDARLPEPPPRLDDARLRRVVAHVEDRLAEPMTLADLAAVAHLSRFHFARAFKTATGHSPGAYVARRRVERAKRLLAGPLPLASVALACGFASAAHFARAFKAATGTTPGAYRRAVGD